MTARTQTTAQTMTLQTMTLQTMTLQTMTLQTMTLQTMTLHAQAARPVTLAAVLSASPALAAAFQENGCERCFAETLCLTEPDSRRVVCLECLEIMVDAARAESALTADSSAGAVCAAFEAGWNAAGGCFAEERPGLLHCFLARFPQFTEALMSAAIARWADSWGLADSIPDSIPDGGLTLAA